MSTVEQIYGLPVYLDKINANTYPKNKILSQTKGSKEIRIFLACPSLNLSMHFFNLKY